MMVRPAPRSSPFLRRRRQGNRSFRQTNLVLNIPYRLLKVHPLGRFIFRRLCASLVLPGPISMACLICCNQEAFPRFITVF